MKILSEEKIYKKEEEKPIEGIEAQLPSHNIAKFKLNIFERIRILFTGYIFVWAIKDGNRFLFDAYLKHPLKSKLKENRA